MFLSKRQLRIFKIYLFIYLFNFLHKYGYEKSIKKAKGCLAKAKYSELIVKWSNNILSSVERSIKTKENKIIK